MYKSWPVVIFEVTIMWISDLYVSWYILRNFCISLTISFWLDTNRTQVNFRVKADFLTTHNLEGKYDDIPYNQSGF